MLPSRLSRNADRVELGLFLHADYGLLSMETLMALGCCRKDGQVMRLWGRAYSTFWPMRGRDDRVYECTGPRRRVAVCIWNLKEKACEI